MELEATDSRGRTIRHSGFPEPGPGGTRARSTPERTSYRSLQLDERGNVINKRNAWAARSVAYVRLIPPGAADTFHDASVRERWNDYGIGLLLQGDLKGAEAAFLAVTRMDPGYADAWVNVGRASRPARLPWLGQTALARPDCHFSPTRNHAPRRAG